MNALVQQLLAPAPEEVDPEDALGFDDGTRAAAAATGFRAGADDGVIPRRRLVDDADDGEHDGFARSSRDELFGRPRAGPADSDDDDDDDDDDDSSDAAAEGDGAAKAAAIREAIRRATADDSDDGSGDDDGSGVDGEEESDDSDDGSGAESDGDPFGAPAQRSVFEAVGDAGLDPAR